MMIDCGTLSGDPTYWRGWNDEVPHDLLILVHTPGIPIEWIHAAFRLSPWYRRKLHEHMTSNDMTPFEEAGRDNAQTITADDGLKMLIVVCPAYKGPAPLYSSLALKAAPESDQKIANLLGVSRQKVQRWRTRHVFDPLTGVRIVNKTGWPMGRKRKC